MTSTDATDGGQAAIAVQGLSLTFAGSPPVRALDSVDLRVEAGQFAALVGPSGCGKSTLLRVLAGLAMPDRGAATLLGQEATGRTGAAAYMPQRDALLPWRRALDNATLGAELTGVPRREARAAARALLGRFGLEGFENAWPAQLSGGMRQRLALLRTFLAPREVLLLDEPFGALDALTRREMHGWLQEVWSREGRRSALLVTHDVDEALTLADVVFVMSPRPGSVVARIDVELPRPRMPADTVSAQFAGLKGQVLSALSGAPPGAIAG